MRIEQFILRAFGHFTDLTLDFSAQEIDFHVIYGPNEAGKSSALRALKAWLFGFPERTRDDFLHPRPQLLVGGTLVEGKNQLRFFRRKKRKGDITDPDGILLDPALLRPFLGGLDLSLFESLHGIDHAGLVQGGLAMLEQGGEIGQTLFSAGAGLGTLHQVLAEMEAERDALFRARASKPSINKALSKHKVLQKNIQSLLLRPEEWQERSEQLNKVEQDLADTMGERRRLEKKRQYLERLHRVLPLLARQKKLQEQQQALGPYHPLPVDFSETRKKVQEKLSSTRQRLGQFSIRRQQVEARLGELSPQKLLIARTSQIEDLFQRLGAYKKAGKDRPRLQGMRAVHIREAEELLTNMAPQLDREHIDQLQGLARQKKKILALVDRHTALTGRLRDNKVRTVRLEEQLVRAQKKLADQSPPAGLEVLQAAVNRARKDGDLDGMIRRCDQAIADKEEATALALKQLGRWRGTCAELLALALPSGPEIERFRDSLHELQQQKQHLLATIATCEEEQRQLRKQRHELTHAGAIPSEQELAAVRQRRDTGYGLLCQQWIEQQDVTREIAMFCQDADLSAHIFDLIQQTDQLGDQLRLQANRVHAFAAIQAAEEELADRLQDVNQQLTACNNGLAKEESSWITLWQHVDITPDVPAVMAQWRTELLQLQQLAAEQKKDISLAASYRQQRQDLFVLLKDVLGTAQAAADTLAPLLQRAEEVLANRQRQDASYRQLARDVAGLEEQLQAVRAEREQTGQDMTDWQQEWQQLARLPDQEIAFAPDEARDLFDTMALVLIKLGKADELKARMLGIDRDCRDLEDEVQMLVKEVAPDLANRPVAEVVQQLHDRLNLADKEQAKYDENARELQELQGQILEEQHALNLAEEEMQQIMAMAGCSQEQHLAGAEQCAADHRRFTEQLEQLEQDIQQVAGGVRLEEITARARSIDPDSLPGELRDIALKISEELDPAIQHLAEQKGEVRKILEQMDGSHDAAREAEELEANLAGLELDASEFLRLQIGIDLLKQEIEEFRQRNQDPVLRRASTLFSRLTNGAFKGLGTDVDNQNTPVLVGIRREVSQPVVMEAMSTGSRDQLYLALRLASLQHRMSQGRAMPFIVDDILINFDEERTAATLEVLAEHGRQEQVILFTHHQYVADQARNLDGVRVHDLLPVEKAFA